MPRFLDTWTGEFVWVADPSQVTYAILSHVWRKPEDGGEQSFDDVRKIQAVVNKDREEPRSHSASDIPTRVFSEPPIYTDVEWHHIRLPDTPEISTSSRAEYDEACTIFSHPGLSDKIKGFCKIARDAGFRLVWNDTCCIDKSSSAELSEAISSMYEWYRLSNMCYVYLADVSAGHDLYSGDSEFDNSEWHRRGWTLQELIAPERVFFLTSTWNFLGTKTALASILKAITGIDFNILTRQATLDSISVARRMSWAAKRETTRVEDRAYSLMGIFGIHMSPLYGEGENAFLRLQEEIIRTIPDQSIFAWGVSCAIWSQSAKTRDYSDENWTSMHTNPGLLATSPDPFFHCGDITPITSSRLVHVLRLNQGSDCPPLHCIFTPEGVRMRLLCLPIAKVPRFLDAFCRRQRSNSTCLECSRFGLGELNTLALLQCQDGYDHLIALPLSLSCEEGGNKAAFRIGSLGKCVGLWGHEPYHTIYLNNNEVAEVLERVRPTAVDVLLLRRYSHPPIPKSLQMCNNIPLLDLHRTVFKIAPHSIDGLRPAHIVPSPLQAVHSEDRSEVTLTTTLSFVGVDDSSEAPRAIELSIRLNKILIWSHSRVLEQSHDLVYVSAKGVNLTVSRYDESPITGTSASMSHHHSAYTRRVLPDTYKIDNCTHMMEITGSALKCPTIVQAEYTVHVNTENHTELAGHLRVGLEHTFARSIGQHTPIVWVAIELSAKDGEPGLIRSSWEYSPSECTDDVSEECLSDDSDENNSSYVASSAARTPILGIRSLPCPEATMSLIPSELSDNSGPVATIDRARSAKVESSDISSPSVPVQKRLRQASLDAELFGSDHAKRARISSPHTDHRGLLEERSSLRRPLPYPGTVKSGSTVGIGTLGDGQGTVVDSIWSGHKEDKVAITPRRALMHPPGTDEEGTASRASAELRGITEELGQSAARARCAESDNGDPLRHEVDSSRMHTSTTVQSSAHLPSSTGTLPPSQMQTRALSNTPETTDRPAESASSQPSGPSSLRKRSHGSVGDVDAQRAWENDSADSGSRREIAALRAQVAHLTKQNTDLSSTVEALSSQMQIVIAQLSVRTS